MIRLQPKPRDIAWWLLVVILLTLCIATRAHAQTVNASDTASLIAAIKQVNAGTATAINITSNITLTANLPAIQNSVTITGNSNTLSGNNTFGGFIVSSGTVSISDLTISAAKAQGGNGGNGDGTQGPGGGGAGLGGALFVANGANVTVNNVQLTSNSATGGAGGGTGAAGSAGSAFGSGIFLQGNGTLTFSPSTGQTQTVSDVIADQTGSGGTGGNAGSYSLTKSGAGTLTLSAANTYSGGTTIMGGLIHFSASNNFGSGTITLNGGGLQWASGTTTDISSRLGAFGNSGATFDTNSNNVTLASVLSGSGGPTSMRARSTSRAMVTSAPRRAGSPSAAARCSWARASISPTREPSRSMPAAGRSTPTVSPRRFPRGSPAPEDLRRSAPAR